MGLRAPASGLQVSWTTPDPHPEAPQRRRRAAEPRALSLSLCSWTESPESTAIAKRADRLSTFSSSEGQDIGIILVSLFEGEA